MTTFHLHNLKKHWKQDLSAATKKFDKYAQSLGSNTLVEFDLNFMVLETSGQKYILKVMRADCPSDLVDMQCAAIRRLEKKKLPIPKIIPSLSGTDYCFRWYLLCKY